ncbi:MAG TPA: response regulator transcription factor [Thermodesulfovibrionales bacterium]|nr:response regulator transcription factor [Thermodesulfovibrionales bacterium]
MSKITVLIVDDHALVREGIVAFLKHCDDIEVVAEASDGLEAIEKVNKFNPDVVVMDIAMPKLGGLEATVELKKMKHDIKILILTQYDDKEYIARFLKAGVSGYLLKRAVGSDLISAIRAVNRGEVYLFSSIAAEVVAGYLGKDKKPTKKDPYEKLTDREKQVLKLIAEGYTHKEIADMLSISVKTVIAHQTNITEKCGLHTRASLIKFAIQSGIIKIET